ncbi:hypothetical protein [Nocardia alba]|uniref:Mce-associated membrane protein n=1 Tax=Nocardia alba TaxID=225051 RepID=A0A4R1FIW8_9NOCA|nr:hypothetical protein [Nocardia alba]TCJ93139.1 Mce-associated membrane protein [Nocardia alba]
MTTDRAVPPPTTDEAAAGTGRSAVPIADAAVPRRYRRAAIPATALISVAAVATATWLAVDNHGMRAREQAREAAHRAACAYAPTLARYDAKDLDTYFGAVLAGATGDWKTEFDATSRDLREVLMQGQVVATVGTVECAIESADETTAEAVAVINQTITSLGTKGAPAPGQLAVSMTLRKDADRWLVSEVSSPMLAH